MGVPANQYQRVIAALKKDIAENKGHLDTGIFGTQFFFEVLTENGLHDVAYEAMNKRDEPSFGHWLELGSTTTREQWSEEGSHNHPMFGGGLAWYYRKLAGMNADPDAPGFKNIIFRPEPVGDLTYVKYFNQTTFGEAGIFWKNDPDQFFMQVTVPVGSTAQVYIPIKKGQKVTESGKSASSKNVKFLREADGYRIYSLTSGNFNFLAK
jgi:alpha-L-rhamnosidase